MKTLNKIMCVIGWITTILFIGSLVIGLLYMIMAGIIAYAYLLIPIVVIVAIILVIVKLCKKK